MPCFSAQYVFKLKMTGQGYQDECVLRYKEQVSFGFDGAFDAYKIGSVNPAAPYLASYSLNNDYSINSVPVEWMNTPIGIRALAGTTGTYNIAYEEIDSLPSGVCVILYDSLLQTATDIRTSVNYSAFFQSGFQGMRFSVRVVAPLWREVFSGSCDGSQDGSIRWYNPPVPGSNFQLIGPLGSAVFSYSGVDSFVVASNLSPGTYIIQYSGTAACNQLNDTVEIFTSLPPIAGFTYSDDTLSIQGGDVLVLADTSMYTDSVSWNMGDGNVYAGTDSVFHTYTSDGTYTITQYVYYGTCADSVQQTVQVFLTVGLKEQYVINIIIQDAGLRFMLPFQPSQLEVFDFQGRLLHTQFSLATHDVLTLQSFTRGSVLFRFSNSREHFITR